MNKNIVPDVELEMEIEASLVFVYFDEQRYTVAKSHRTKKLREIWNFLHTTELELKIHEDVDLFEPALMQEILEQQQNFNTSHLMWELVDIGVFGFIFLVPPLRTNQIFEKYFGTEFKRTN